MDRIRRTAHTPQKGPNMATGYGVVDPIAALTYQLPPPQPCPLPPPAGPFQVRHDRSPTVGELAIPCSSCWARVWHSA